MSGQFALEFPMFALIAWFGLAVTLIAGLVAAVIVLAQEKERLADKLALSQEEADNFRRRLAKAEKRLSPLIELFQDTL